MLKLKWIVCAVWIWALVGLGQVEAWSEDRPGQGFKILIWPFHTNILEDFRLYRELGLGGFQIDSGVGKYQQIRMSVENDFPFYGGHVADKGYLHLKKENRALVTGKNAILKRPLPLSDPSVIRKAKDHIRRNISALKEGNVLAYALDDEPSLASFVNPSDVDVSDFSISLFQKWLRQQYTTIVSLNLQWSSDYISFNQIQPVGFEQIRKGLSFYTVGGWNLSAWMDFREFMDIQFADTLKELVAYSNTIDPCTPAGIVGGQAPAAWGGYDYGRLSRAVQWMEAYDIHGTNEILRSFWCNPKKIRMQTFFSRKDRKQDSWFLWYYMLHGNQAVIAWPEGWFKWTDGKKSPSEYIRTLAPIFHDVQGKVSEIIVDQKTVFSPDPIGIYYSQPSIRASWVMDALVHGKTWPNRLSSIDNENQSAGVLRKAWCKMLEDIGFQYDFINYLDVKESKIDLNKHFKLIILPKTVCLSEKEAMALTQFVLNGGVLIADNLCGIFDEHGKWRGKGIIDGLFGIRRSDEVGYLNGKGLAEIDAEKYKAPFSQRFTYYNGAFEHNGLVIFERGTKNSTSKKHMIDNRPDSIIKKQTGKGWTCYMNLSPIQYWSSDIRNSGLGRTWRAIIESLFETAGLIPRVKISVDNDFAMLEALFWKNGKNTYLGIVQNPSDSFEQVNRAPIKITIAFNRSTELQNLRTGKSFAGKKRYQDKFYPWEANLYLLAH